MSTPTTGDDRVVIGMPEIYRSMKALELSMSALIGKFDTSNAAYMASFDAIRRDLRDHDKKFDDHEMRIRELSARPIISPRAMWTGVGVVITGFGVLTALLSIIIDVVGK